MKKMLKKVAIVMTSISLLNYPKIVLADQFDDWQTTVMDTMADFDQTDSNTTEFIQYIQDSYYDVKALDEWPNSDDTPACIINFAMSVGYFKEKFEETSIGYSVGEYGWIALRELYDGDSDGYEQAMEHFKIVFEESGALLYENQYSSGQYKIGIDMPAGEYVLFSDSGSGYYAVSSDSNGTEILSNDNFDYNSVITVDEGTYIKLSRCMAVPAEEVEKIDMSKGNMFRVGKDIEAGEYSLESTGSDGYYCIYSDSRQQGTNSIVANENFSGNTYVTVSDGQYLKLSRCAIKE